MKSFVQGYVCAVATVAEAYGEVTIADGLLRAIGKINWRQIDEYDRAKLKEAGMVLKRYAG